MAGTAISDGNVKASLTGSEKIPVSGASTPVITVNQIIDRVFLSGGTLSGPNTITGTTTNTLKYVFNSLGVTQVNGAGHWLSNTTLASSGNQQISPSTTWEGQGWKTDATAASQSVKITNYLLPVQGSANPTSQLKWLGSINGGSYHELMRLNDDGVTGSLTMIGSGSSISAENITASVTLIASSNFYIGSGVSALSISSSSGVAVIDSFSTGNLSQFKINASVFIGGITTPTGRLHIAAGAAGAGTSPIKLTSGTNNTTAEAGAIEYNGTNLFFTRSGTTREGVLTQSAVTTEVVVSDTTVTVNIGGTTFKLLAKS